MMAEMTRFLVQKGYVPLRVHDRVVSAAAKNTLSVLGDASSRALLFHMAVLTGLP